MRGCIISYTSVSPPSLSSQRLSARPALHPGLPQRFLREEKGFQTVDWLNSPKTWVCKENTFGNHTFSHAGLPEVLSTRLGWLLVYTVPVSILTCVSWVTCSYINVTGSTDKTVFLLRNTTVRMFRVDQKSSHDLCCIRQKFPTAPQRQWGGNKDTDSHGQPFECPFPLCKQDPGEEEGFHSVQGLEQATLIGSYCFLRTMVLKGLSKGKNTQGRKRRAP